MSGRKKNEIMTTEIFWINEESMPEKSLGIMPRPRGKDWLEDEIKWMEIKGLNFLVSLLEFGEIEELGLTEEASLCEKYNIDFINFPIQDVSLPRSETDFLSLVETLNSKINDQQKIVIHCRMGIGRSSVLASAILIRRGVPKDLVFELISEFRTLSVPDTEEQKNWILALADKIGTDE